MPLKELYYNALHKKNAFLTPALVKQLKCDLRNAVQAGQITQTEVESSLRVAQIAYKQCSLGSHSVVATLLYKCQFEPDYIQEKYDSTTRELVEGLSKIYALYKKYNSIKSDNFRKLLLSFAQDVRVIIIMIVERLDTMRSLATCDTETQRAVAGEVQYLYAPLAHRMGLYAIKTELEDLSLKYLQTEQYRQIAAKLNETKASRDSYIDKFIAPIKERLAHTGLKFEIKGRTKSIYSIHNKMCKQQCAFENVYDLFAIRIIIDCPEAQESSACWNVYSEITSMYTPNTNRLRDWISTPKSNGYESLHITVMGPEGKWVEVQIRTRRMDEVAEKGVAAHWKYKGGKSDSDKTDLWLKNLRQMLESNSDMDQQEIMDEFKMQLYDDDVFVFTPKGDLHQLKKGAIILDFAYQIHSRIGDRCTGAIVNGKHTSFKQKLQNGDQVEILTSASQQPSPSWLGIVKTQKAKYHIRQAIEKNRKLKANGGREIVERKLKNWKIEISESELSQIAKKAGYKKIIDFYVAVNDEKLELTRDLFAQDVEQETTRSAMDFTQETDLQKRTKQQDALVIDGNVKGLKYSMAKCCNPVYGDEIFGYVSAMNGIKIHRKNCPNASDLYKNYGYRIVKAHWAGNSSQSYAATIHIIGRDDIGIVNNISSVINKENGVGLQSINISSADGIFEGNITIMISNLSQLESITHKLKEIKGVKGVSRT